MPALKTLYTLALALLATLLGAGQASAISLDKTLSTGKIRIHYSTTTPASCDVILLGVGTAMSASSYDTLSGELNKYGYVTVILDHAPGSLTKTSASQYAALANEVKANLTGWLGGTCTGVAHWLMGGHSAGGQAAQAAIADSLTQTDAIFSIDPYNANNAGTVNVPALYWGFDVTTCFVTKDDAAKAAYQRSQSQRAFYRVAAKYSWGPCGYSPKYFHCSFCDGHCPACTNCMQTPAHFFVDVAASVNKFITAAFYGNWSKSALKITATTPVTLFVDTDQP